MKLIIAGGRDIYPSKDFITTTLNTLLPSDSEITEIVCRGAAGADSGGQIFAYEVGLDVKMFPADWDNNGKAAGPIRNREWQSTQMPRFLSGMVKVKDLVI